MCVYIYICNTINIDSNVHNYYILSIIASHQVYSGRAPWPVKPRRPGPPGAGDPVIIAINNNSYCINNNNNNNSY